MGGDSGVECCGDCAVEHGRRLRERSGAGEYRGGRAEEVENGVLLWVKTQRRSTPSGAKDSGWREAFHAAEVSNGGERSWISADHPEVISSPRRLPLRNQAFRARHAPARIVIR
jgi:hypothetical protein